MKKKSSSFIKFPEVKIVQASAGSGKTYALARRYIQLLINNVAAKEEIPLRNILAITFTHKATREMRERILELLKKIALDVFASANERNDLLTSLQVPESEAKARAFAVLDHIISHYNFFQVKNIDSFINVILSGCALELNLSANFRIKENYSNYVSYALDEAIDLVQTDQRIEKIFKKFLSQYLFLENRTSWFAKKDILEILKGVFSQSNIYGGNFEKFPMDDRELISLKKKILNILKDIHEQAPEGMNKPFLNSLEKFSKNNETAFNLADLKSQKFYQDVLPMNKNKAAAVALDLKWREFRSLIVLVSEKEALSLFNCYIEIYDEVYQLFRDTTYRDDVIFMEELNKQARFLFEETDLSVPELYYRLASKFQHFLIDEFQDTSNLQWNNLFLMVEDALANGGSLFYVGDKKQAIYRFRGGDVKLFDQVRYNFEKFNINEQETLKINYRSQKEVVEFNNKIFSQNNLRRFLETQQSIDKDDLRQLSDEHVEEILSVFKDSQQEYIPDKVLGRVKVEHIKYTNKDEKEELVKAELIGAVNKLKLRFPLKSIAILCRSNREIELVTGWLLEEKINVESERTLNIKNNPLIRELVAFLKFLNSPLDTISFCAFILSDIFIQATGLDFKQVSNFIFEFNFDKKEKKGALYRDFKNKFPEVWDNYIADFFKSVGFVSLYELTVSFLDKFRVLDKFRDYQGFFMRFLELIREQEEDYPDISLFLDYWEITPEPHLYVNFSDENAIKVMTIHKAKGLGFSVVLVPFLEMNIRELGAQIKRLRVPYVVYEKENKNNFGLLRLDAKYAKFSPRIKEIYRREYVNSFIDELNVIYVTFTRAECELYLFIPSLESKISGSSNAVCSLIPEEIQEAGTAADYDLKRASNKSLIMPIAPAEYFDWFNVLKEEFTTGKELKNRQNIMRGEILHHLLSFIDNLNQQNLDNLQNMLKARLACDFPDVESPEEYVQIILKLVCSKKTNKFFDSPNAENKIFREKEFINKNGRTFRLDRLIISRKEALIIDFKSSEENKIAHMKQMQEYIKIITSIYPDKKVSGFLVYMDKIKVVQV